MSEHEHRAMVLDTEVIEVLRNEGQESEECWEWSGTRDRDGYGVKTIKGKQWRVHRLAYAQATGEDIAERWVLHHCDNPPCYRPSHLYAGDAQDNADDKVERDRCRNQYTDAQVCVRGHEFTSENTYRNPASGSRQCRMCRRINGALDRALRPEDKETRKVLKELYWETQQQHLLYGEQNWPDGTGSEVDGWNFAKMADLMRRQCDQAAQDGTLTWRHIFLEEVFEALAESDEEKLLVELNQAAAVAAQWRKSIRRRQARRAAMEAAGWKHIGTEGYIEQSDGAIIGGRGDVFMRSQTEVIDSQDTY